MFISRKLTGDEIWFSFLFYHKNTCCEQRAEWSLQANVYHIPTHTHIHTPVSSLFSAIKSLNVASFRCQLLSSPRRSSLAWPPCENLLPFGVLVGSLPPLVLLLVGTAVTSVLDAKLCLPVLSILCRSQWPRVCLRPLACWDCGF